MRVRFHEAAMAELAWEVQTLSIFGRVPTQH